MKTCRAKDMTGEMAAAYNPIEVESGWYDYWEKEGFFKPASDRGTMKKDAQSYVIVLPPPNVTGSLHLGHALTSAVQDTLIRWHRMLGDNTLYVPGLDHAGIATQVVVEKKLKVEENKTRHDLGREEFVRRVWKWKEEYGGRICQQLKKTGTSLDWSRLAFSMDGPRNDATVEAFCRLHRDGKITRAVKLINWCCTLRSAISDIEVEYIDIDKETRLRVPGYEKTVEVGYLFNFAYKVVGLNEEIVVATTRAETILGDTAVAIHPDDPRYKHLHGKKLKCPFRNDEIPIICDSTLVDMNFGTGAVKVTPAHDPNDFEAGVRHKLPMISIFTEEGLINDAGAPFTGMKRFDCRKAIEQKLEEMGLAKGTTPHAMRVGLCSRTNDIIEPFLKPQWFVDCDELAKRSVKAVEDGELRIIPDSHNAVWFHWLKNIRPWCISRQLWWGHRIPAYYATIGPRDLSKDEDVNAWVVAHNEEEAVELAMKKLGLKPEERSKLCLEQDPDVLDTWFSAGLHPFYTLGWPDTNHPDYKLFFPTTLLETGHDILFFWVARMVMMSLALTDKLPYRDVYLHALVRDKSGRKMSKTLGNVIDPLDVMTGISLEDLHKRLLEGNLDKREIEKAKDDQKKQYPKGIQQCGSDALRFGLLSYTVSGKSVNLDVDRVVGYRHFCNKLWNATRFALFFLMGEKYVPPSRTITPEQAAQAPFNCRWILSRLDKAVMDVTSGFREYDFALATTAVYNFWLYDFCDVFLELTKPVLKKEGNDKEKTTTQHVMWVCMETGLRLLHPMMPFVTEELWHRLPGGAVFHEADSIMISDWPTPTALRNEAVEAQMEQVKDVIHHLRSTKMALQIPPKDRPDVFVYCRNDELAKLCTAQSEDISFLAVVGTVAVSLVNADAAPPKGCVCNVVDQHATVYISVKGLIDPVKELDRLGKKVAAAKKREEAGKKRKSAPGYEEKVPADVKERNAQEMAAIETELAELDKAISEMTRLKDELK